MRKVKFLFFFYIFFFVCNYSFSQDMKTNYPYNCYDKALEAKNKCNNELALIYYMQGIKQNNNSLKCLIGYLNICEKAVKDCNDTNEVAYIFDSLIDIAKDFMTSLSEKDKEELDSILKKIEIKKNNAIALFGQRQRQRQRQILNRMEIEDSKGEVDYGKLGDWNKIIPDLKIENGMFFKTYDDSYLILSLVNGNTIKICSDTVLKVESPTFVELIDGDITLAISIEGRGILHIKVSNINIIGQSGLFKVIYRKEKDCGEIVVKNGLVEVRDDKLDSKPVKLSGFYKVSFEKGELSKPVQASVIQYDWH